MAAMEMRVALGRLLSQLDGSIDPAGRSAMWVRIPGGHRLITSADLAIIGDHMPAGIGHTLGVLAGGSSLDNTIRVIDHAETEWVLVDIDVSAVAHGFGHGFAHLWAEDGTLLATASQTSVVRRFLGMPG
jgi:acyl-CoA thioesterase